MIKVPYKELSKVTFIQSFQKLMSSPMKSPGLFRIVHMGKKFQEELNGMKKKYEKDIVEVFAQKDEKGNALPPDEASAEAGLSFMAKTGEVEAAKSATESFGDFEIVVKQKPITPEELFSVNEWSAAEVIALDPILLHEDGGEVVPLRQ